jgi:hypothetical protein
VRQAARPEVRRRLGRCLGGRTPTSPRQRPAGLLVAL